MALFILNRFFSATLGFFFFKNEVVSNGENAVYFKKIVLKKKITIASTFLKVKTVFFSFKENPLIIFNFKNHFFFIRKSKFFSKTRFSRIRQICKNIVLFTLSLNVISVFKTNEIYFSFFFNNSGFGFILVFAVSVFLYLKK